MLERLSRGSGHSLLHSHSALQEQGEQGVTGFSFSGGGGLNSQKGVQNSVSFLQRSVGILRSISGHGFDSEREIFFHFREVVQGFISKRIRGVG